RRCSRGRAREPRAAVRAARRAPPRALRRTAAVSVGELYETGVRCVGTGGPRGGVWPARAPHGLGRAQRHDPAATPYIRKGPMYQIYALKYAERDTSACQFFYREHTHDPITLHYFVWLILGGPHPVLVDTGFQEDDVERRGIRNYVRPSTMVERMGVKVADIPIALISHLHYDHWAGHRLFPASEFWIQKDEVAFWTGPFARYDAFSQSQNVGALTNLVPLNYGGRIKIIEGEHQVLPGLRVHRVGGHTAGLQIVSVETSRGRVVLTSDAAHFYRNVERYQPTQIITNLPEMLAGFDTINAL